MRASAQKADGWRRGSGWGGWWVGVAVLGGGATVLAEPPQVRFDLPALVAGRDVTPAAWQSREQKLVEIKLELSSLHQGGREEDLDHYFVRVAGQHEPLRIVDYLPKTQHEALTSPLSVQDSTEQTFSLGITLGGKYELFSLTGPTIGTAGKTSSSVKYERLPPLETVAASGTLGRGSELFVKLRATARHRLEGSRQIALVIQVPAAWRGTVLRVDCEAFGIRRGVVSALDQMVLCGQQTLRVAVYLEGDWEGQTRARQLAARQGWRTETADPPAGWMTVPRWSLRLPRVEPVSR